RLTSRGFGTIGGVDILEVDAPCIVVGHVWFLRVKDRDFMSPRYLLHYLRSGFGQMQMERYTVGSTGQTELNRDDVKRILVIYPKRNADQEELAEVGHSLELQALSARTQYVEKLALAKKSFAQSLGLG
ncbi:MAG: hypothetical protein Q8O76_12335, partial [Chloroflexota bacterium]|nr:hypothetical protein [Chloroflexota bacterium]